MIARTNEEFTILPSASRTATATSGDFRQVNYRGLMILLDVTDVGATAGSISEVNVQAKVKDNAYVSIYTFGSLTIDQAGQHAFLIYPGAATAGGFKSAPAQGVIPQNWRLEVKLDTSGNSITYSVKGVYLL